jgi:adenylate cyclase
MSLPRLSIRLKAALLMVALAALPALVVAWRLGRVNRAAVEVSEQNLQASVLAEVAAATLRCVGDIEAEARAVANALALAAARPSGEDALDGVRALVGTRVTFDAARFEVPSAKVDTVIARKGASQADVPRSSDEQRRVADERNVSLALDPAGDAIVVVPVPRAPGGAKGYVTVRASLGPIKDALREVADTRFDHGGATLLVVDRAWSVVAGAGDFSTRDVSRLPVFALLGPGSGFSQRLAVVSPYQDGGERFVGGVETVPELGWAVALFRPERLAYAASYEMQRQSAWVVIIALLAALAVGLLAGSAVTRPVLAVMRQAKLIGQRKWNALELASGRRDEIGDLSRAVGAMADDLRTSEREMVREAKLRGDLSRFMSRDLVDAIVAGEHSLALGGHRAEVTVLFADVVAFTPLAESRPAEEVVTILNELFSMLSEIVFRHRGTVDKFIGDCIMAVWGAPVAQADHARRALAAAEDMLRFLETANQVWSEKLGVELRLAIGINSGEAIVGNIGSDKRMEYTVVGDVVNVAARLEAIAKPNQILVAERSRELAGEGFQLISLGPHQLTGRTASTVVYELGLEGDG